MSLRLEMLQVARLARVVLGDEACGLIEVFVRGQQQADGGFADREGRSDLYYTVFALDALNALQVPLPLEEVENFLRGYAEGAELDFIHRCCLARLWSYFPAEQRPSALLPSLEAWRTPDGGYHQRPSASGSSAYGTMLALGAYGDWSARPPAPERLLSCLEALRSADGAWGNEPQLPEGSTTATAAVVTLLRHLSVPVPESVSAWLLAQRHPQGGFKATPRAPMPDLLSTAVALHALDATQTDWRADRDVLLDFVDSLWSARGGFHGHWADDALDLEYTYYGLLALGHLAV
jgi:prenyltransferase beta subunit